MVAVHPADRRLLRAILVVAIVAGAWQVWNRVEARRLEQAAAPLLAEAARPLLPSAPEPHPGSDDAARYYAAAAVAAIGEQPYQPMPAYLMGLVERVRAAQLEGKSLDQGDVEAARRALDGSRVSIELARKATDLPFRRFAPGTSFGYRMNGLMGVHAAVALETLDAVRRGDSLTAATCLRTRLRMMRALEPDAFPANEKAREMFELATDIGSWLSMHPSDEALTLVGDPLAEVYTRDELPAVIARSGRYRYEMYASVAHLAQPFLRHEGVSVLRASAKALELSRLPPGERLQAMNGLPDDGHQVAYQARATTIAVAFGVASQRTARLALVIEQLRRGGRMPKGLGDVVISPGEALSDPFSGEPLRYRPTADGFVVYSVGTNLRDDGGRVGAAPTTGLGPSMMQRVDVGVRVSYRPS